MLAPAPAEGLPAAGCTLRRAWYAKRLTAAAYGAGLTAKHRDSPEHANIAMVAWTGGCVAGQVNGWITAPFSRSSAHCRTHPWKTLSLAVSTLPLKSGFQPEVSEFEPPETSSESCVWPRRSSCSLSNPGRLEANQVTWQLAAFVTLIQVPLCLLAKGSFKYVRKFAA